MLKVIETRIGGPLGLRPGKCAVAFSGGTLVCVLAGLIGYTKYDPIFRKSAELDRVDQLHQRDGHQSVHRRRRAKFQAKILSGGVAVRASNAFQQRETRIHETTIL